jgi:ankyrin repeat protein
MESRYLNSKITKIFESMGYPLPSKGYCSGFSIAWIAARKNGTQHKFIERCKFLAEIPFDTLKRGIDEAKNKVINKIALTTDDLKFLEVNAFLDNIYLAQNAVKAETQSIFGKPYTDQSDIESISQLIASDNLVNQGGIKTPFKTSAVLRQQELAKYLSDLGVMLQNIKQANDSCYDLTLYNYNHATCLMYNHHINKWHVIDSNRIDLIDTPLTAQEAAKSIMSSFPLTGAKHQYSALKQYYETFTPNYIEEMNIENILNRLRHDKAELDTPKEVADEKKEDNESSLVFTLQLAMTEKYVEANPELSTFTSAFREANAATKEMGERSSENGITLAIIAAYSNDADTLRRLCKLGIDINKPLEKDESLEYLPNSENVRLLDGTTPIEMTVFHNHPDSLRVFIENGYDLNATNKDGLTLAHLAARENRPEILGMLADNGANLNYFSSNCLSPLMVSISRLNIPIFKLLIEKGSDYLNLLKISISRNQWADAAFMLANLDYRALDKESTKEFTRWFTGKNREKLTNGFIDLKNMKLEGYETIARDVIDGKNALGVILNTPPSKIRFLFSTHTHEGNKVTSSISKVAKSISSDSVLNSPRKV